MIGVLWYYTTVVCAGVWLAGTRAGKFLTLPEIVASAIPLAAVGGAWIVFIASMMWSAFTAPVVYAATAFMVWRAWAHRHAAWQRLRVALGGSKSATGAARDGWIALGVVVAMSTFLWPIYSSRMIPTAEDGAVMTAGSCYGDLPIHMAIANSFLVGCNTEVNWPARRSDGSVGLTSVIYAGEPLTYPFLPDFHGAIFVALGDTLRNGFLHPGFSLLCALWALLFLFTVRVGRSRIGGVIAVALTFGAGGMGGIRWLLQDGWGALKDNDVVQHDPTGEWKHLWFAFVPHIMLPQRGAVFAYPMAMLALLLVWAATDSASAWAVPAATSDGAPALSPSSSSSAALAPASASVMSLTDRRRMLILAAGIAATLPMHQAHAFIGVGIIIGVIFLFDMHKWGRDLRLLLAWGEAGILAAAMGVPQMLLFTKTANEGFGGKFTENGWLFHNYEFGQPGGVVGFYNFWWHSLGPLFHLFTAAGVLLAAEVAWGWRLAGELVKDGGPGAVARFIDHHRDNAGVGLADAAGGHGAGVAVALGLTDKIAGAGGPATGAAATAAQLPQRGSLGAGAIPGPGSGSGASVDPELPMSPAHDRGHGHGHGRSEASISSSAAASASASSSGGDRGDRPSLIERVAGALFNVAPSAFARPVPLLGAALAAVGLDAGADARGNALTPSQRALDALKLGFGSLLVFLLGNYVRMQPWDRDNAKIFYIWVFVAAALVGPLLAAPADYALGSPACFSFLPRLLAAARLAPAAPRAGFASALKKDDDQRASASGSGSSASASGVSSRGGSAGARFGGSSGARSSTSPTRGSGAGAAAAVVAAAPPRTAAGVAIGGGLSLASLALLVLCTFSGCVMVWQEYHAGNAALFDRDSVAVGEYFKGHVHPHAVTMHSNHHTQPSCSIAGRPSLVSYFGWVSNHGYNAGPRLQDRDYVMDNLLKDSDGHAYNLLRRWGVRYIVGEYMRRHGRAPLGSRGANGNDENLFLDGKVRRIYNVGRFDVFEVTDYGDDEIARFRAQRS